MVNIEKNTTSCWRNFKLKEEWWKVEEKRFATEKENLNIRRQKHRLFLCQIGVIPSEDFRVNSNYWKLWNKQNQTLRSVQIFVNLDMCFACNVPMLVCTFWNDIKLHVVCCSLFNCNKADINWFLPSFFSIIILLVWISTIYLTSH